MPAFSEGWAAGPPWAWKASGGACLVSQPPHAASHPTAEETSHAETRECQNEWGFRVGVLEDVFLSVCTHGRTAHAPVAVRFP